MFGFSKKYDIRMEIDGMHCDMCRGKVEKALSETPGIEKVTVDLKKKEALLTGKADTKELKEIVEALGFSVVHVEEK